ncbi:MAG TPA: SHOCT domain-containing protein [Candidatus Limnocylindrales bacterium]|nr:SHOCT domain-containing protein [Candidatus Limnocylindrales bacterium]
MLDAVESGTLPPRKQSKGFLSRWLPGGDDTDDHGAAQSARPAPEADSPAQARPMPQAADDRDRDMSAAPAAAEEAQDRPALETGRTPETATPHPSAGAPPRAPAADEPRPVSGRGPEARPVAPATGRERSFEERLEILSRLRDKGLITDEEYRARRRAILDEI